jgi:hypothetical protein
MDVRSEPSFFPPWLAAGREQDIPAKTRPFGASAADLGVEFRMARRPELITELLANCCRTAAGAPVDRGLLMEVPAGMRTEGLLTLAAMTDASPMSWRLRCAQCRQDSEFELSVDQIATFSARHRDRPTMTALINGHEVLLRRPTGSDQANWLAHAGELAVEAMFRSILVRPDLDTLLRQDISLDTIGAAVDDAMDEFDPLVGFHLAVSCPHCQASTEVSPDLAAAALERLARVQYSLIGEVHRLALHYHWSERQILELPEWRRHSYLALIEEVAP